MIVVSLSGGLANQMFQYAYARSLSERGYDVKLDARALKKLNQHGGYQLHHLNINLDLANTDDINKVLGNKLTARLRDLMPGARKTHIRERKLFFDDDLLQPPDNTYISGYFQSYLYFYNIIKAKLKEELLFKSSLSNYAKEIEHDILMQKDTCALHVRRGDYINKKNLGFHGVCDIDYYHRALLEIKKKRSIGLIYVFSDDISWCQKNFDFKDVKFVENDFTRNPHEDLYLMSCCSTNIIANSTYSWWAAWLNKNDDPVIVAPKDWVLDDKINNRSRFLIPSTWMRL